MDDAEAAMRIANHLISLLWLGLSLELISAHIDPLPLRSPPLSEPDPLGHTLHRHGKRARDPRLGSVFRSIPVYRTLGGTNVVTVGLGGREVGDVTQRLNVTVCEYCLSSLRVGCGALNFGVCGTFSNERTVCYGRDDGLCGMRRLFWRVSTNA